MFKCKKVLYFENSISDLNSVHPIKWVPKSDCTQTYHSAELDQQTKFENNNVEHVKLRKHNTNQILNKTNANEMNSHRKNKFHHIMLKYCELIVPPRNQDDVIDGTYDVSLRFWPPPLTMITFSVIQTIIFFIAASYNESNGNASTSIYDMPQNNTVLTLLMYDPNKRNEIWRFLSYMLIHYDKSHIMSNLIMQVGLGIPLELINHWWRVTLVYLAGGLAASMGQSLFSSNGLCGASGGVYSLIVAHIATVIMNWKEMYHPFFQLTVFLIWCGSDTYYSVNEILDGVESISYVAHLFGAVAGLLVGIGVLQNVKPRYWKIKLWCLAVSVFITFLTIGSFINILIVMKIIQI
ncbi:rhomboid-related protein 2-like [Contarinia nasturtii]|uniref:rhomboid-related protein 2-like n=1 Tax=Contarinia nasturtii TaxID=265458 RepID=UPI0012D4602E|nr:rhomboid-related protein 2-like [Contarinia nasturtii]